jgi:hypothetical protein
MSRSQTGTAALGVLALVGVVVVPHVVAYALVVIAAFLFLGAAELLPEVTVKPPKRATRRQLRGRTLKLLADWNAFYVTMLHPDPARYDHIAEYKRRDAAELVFRERVTELERAYQRKGIIDKLTDFSDAQLPSDAHVRTDRLGMALKRLEGLTQR